MSYEKRMAAGKRHERRVAKSLCIRGWHVDFVGQSQLSDEAHTALESLRPKREVRWWPDLLAVKRRGESWLCLLVDAKTGRSDTPNYAIEDDAIRAHRIFADDFGLPVFYVFGDGRVASLGALEGHGGTPGPRYGNGSDTPYSLYPKTIGRGFSEVFGDPVTVTVILEDAS